jgi:hypothetical protein
MNGINGLSLDEIMTGLIILDEKRKIDPQVYKTASYASRNTSDNCEADGCYDCNKHCNHEEPCKNDCDCYTKPF